MLAARVEAVAAALRPAHRHFHARRNLVTRAVGARAFVECHHDIAAQQALDFHAALGREHVFRAIDMAAEFDALLGQLAQFGQAHHLVAAAVGQDRALPVHEFMQTAQPRHPLGPRTQHQVVGIAENNVRARLADGFGLHRLDCRRGPDRHECRRADRAALHCDAASARGTIGSVDVECETFAHGQKP